MAKTKLLKQLQANEVFTKQFSNYKLLHDKASSTIKNKLNMVDKLTDYNGLTKIKYDGEIDHKKKTFHDLEIAIVNVKQDSVDQQNRLNELEKNIKNTIAAVKEQQRRNFHMNNSNIAQNKEFMKAKLNIFKIKNQLQLESIEEIVQIYKDERMKYEGLYLLVYILLILSTHI